MAIIAEAGGASRAAIEQGHSSAAVRNREGQETSQDFLTVLKEIFQKDSTEGEKNAWLRMWLSKRIASQGDGSGMSGLLKNQLLDAETSLKSLKRRSREAAGTIHRIAPIDREARGPGPARR